MKTRLLLILAFTTFFGGSMLGQGTVKGGVFDADTDESLPGASVSVDDGKLGTITNLDGTFELKLPSGKHKVAITFVGYLTQIKEVEISDGTTANLGDVRIPSSAVGINEVMVMASLAIDRKTPVAVSTISPLIIEDKLGTQEFPEILKSTPGIYATRQGGGFGDSRVNVRGFDMKNTAVLVNGIPVNDMENGWVYWSNWAGLGDVTRTIQVQRGLGASKLSIGSVGGTINVLLNTTDAEKGGQIYAGIGNDGYSKQSFSASTGLMENNWAVTFMGAHQKGTGWADATWFEGWSYFMNISKKWDDHILSFTATGAPQEHGQRRTKQLIETVKDPNNGLKWNQDWGYKNGQATNLNVNFYNKPLISLNHTWQINHKSKLSNSAYMSFGTGGGTGDYGSESSKFFQYRKDNLIDYDRIVDENILNGNAGSSAILRASRNDHDWYGLLSNYSNEIIDNLTLSGGIDLRYYKGYHFREVVDLMGGDFVKDDSDDNNPNKLARVGDKIGYYNIGEVNWTGLFAQAEYTRGDLTTFLSASLSNTGYRRTDYFNYLNNDPEQQSDWVNYMGYVAKGGANYNINAQHKVYANAGYFERAPFFDATFINYRNDINKGAINEKTMSFELGYGFKSRNLVANVNAYYTKWKDKFLRRSINRPDGTRYSANIPGVDALHMGVELDLTWKPIRNLEVLGMASLGNWTWQNDLVDVPIYDDNQQEIDRINIYMADLRVGDAAQTTAALGVNYSFANNFKIGLNYNYYDNLYAQFDPASRTNDADKGMQSWKLPSYALLDFNMSYNFEIAGLQSTIYGNVNNITNTEYMTEADDGTNHDWQTSRVFFGVGRTWSTGLRVRF